MDNSLGYKKNFRDICQGYTIISCNLGKFYFKHINVSDQVLLDESKDQYIEEAKNRGIPTVEEALINLKEEGYWTEKDETAIKQEEVFLLKITEQKKNTYLKSQIDTLNKQINDSLTKLNELKNKRSSYLGNTCENYAEQRVTEEFLKFTLFKDADLKNLYFTDDEFDELSSDDLSLLIGFYNKTLTEFADSRIQRLVLEDFFTYYMPYCEDPIHFYGKPIINLTYNQLRLILYARYFKNILSTNDKIPENYRKDPDKLIDYINANEKAKEKMQEKDNQATSIVGATKEDYKYINMDKGNAKSVSLSEEAKKKGGSLDMKDLMKLMGVQ
tara:strand:- start:3259 stop:4245 length:987 start_codon:yes stop_codon:yes gene_type:complete